MHRLFPLFSLIFVCILLNVLCGSVVRAFQLPLYLDSIGTILAAAIGGYLPGIVVGYFSNVINSCYDNINLYYGFISVLLGIAAAKMSQDGFFHKFGKVLFCIFLFSLLGGGLGSVMTWLLFGYNVGEIASFYYTNSLISYGVPKFLAQLTADLGVDFFDKGLTVVVVLLLLRCCPDRWLNLFTPGKQYMRVKSISPNKVPLKNRRQSLHTEIAIVITASCLLVGALSVMIGYALYRNASLSYQEKTVSEIANSVSKHLPADELTRYLADGKRDALYDSVEADLKQIQACAPFVSFIYVYQIQEDGCHVLFDLDTDQVAGSKLGDVIPFDKDFDPYLESLKSGKNIPPIISNGAYGWLLTAYQPVFDSNGNCVAYACVDIPMNNIAADRIIYFIKMFSVLFGLLFVVAAIVIEFVNWNIVRPINLMTQASNEFAYGGEDNRLTSQLHVEQLQIHTGNEIENLYHALAKTTADVTQSEYEKKVILDNIQQPIGLFDSKCHFIAGNAAFLHLKDPLKHSPNSICSDCSICEFHNTCTLKRTAKDNLFHEIQRTINGHDYHIQSQPVLNKDKTLKQIVVTFVDVTEINKAQQQMKEALVLEQEANRNKNLFLSSIGHEIKTPLNAIVGFSDLLASDSHDVRKVEEYATSVKDSATHLQNLFNTILDLIQFDTGKVTLHTEFCDLSKKLNSLQSSFSGFFTERNNTFVLQTSFNLPELRVDEQKIKQILFNLIHNACKYTENGLITLSVKWQENRTLQIDCTDTGVGIPEDKQSKIFDPFYQVDVLRDEHKFKGKGLGLALAKRLAFCMGGKLKVASTLGNGSTFSFILENVETRQPVPKVTDSVDNVPAEFLNTLRVLVLDDILLNVKVLTKLCEKNGLKTFGTTEINNAFRLLQEKKINLILTDIWMPIMNGAEFALKVRQMSQWENFPIYAVTADAAAEQNFDVSVFNRVLQKPIHGHLIKEIINDLYNAIQKSQ